MTLSREEQNALDRLRTRLQQFSASLGNTSTKLANSDPLPSWQDLRSQHDHLLRGLADVQNALNEHRNFFTAAHSYPLPTYPGYSQEGFLGHVMRKKLEPGSEGWVWRHTRPKVDVRDGDGDGDVDGVENGNVEGDVAGKMDNGEYKELWEWAGQKVREMDDEFLEEGAFDDDYTIAEREVGIENVVTGLRRKLDGDDGGSDEGETEGEDEKMEDAMPDKSAVVPLAKTEPGVDTSLRPMQLETLLRFITTGTLPPQS